MKKISFTIIHKISVYMLFLLLSRNVFAAKYEPLEELPGASTDTFASYVNALIKFSIALGTGLAVLMLVIAGVQLITAPANESMRSAAKEKIGNAVWGLVILAISVLLLYKINPELVLIKF
ncbi:MAG: hypothetical protein KAR24_03110 [Candidatus Pacebacteria bacterium]|nr:hypothetical protein [Candidatus Paceibacterota bacterium]